MEYAIIETGGKQYKVNSGDIITVESLKKSEKKEVEFDKVLLYVNDEDVSIGSPYVDSIIVTGKIIDDIKGDKIRVSRFKAKSNYRRVTGHRQTLSQVEIGKITKKSTVKSK